MPKVPSCLMLKHRRSENVSLRRAFTEARTRAVSFDESRASYSIEVPKDFQLDKPVEEIECNARWERANSSFSSRSGLLRSRSRGQSTNLSSLASTDTINENFACHDRQGGQVCPPSPSTSEYDGTWGQFIDFVPLEDDSDSIMSKKYLSSNPFLKGQSLASKQSSLAHPYMAGWNNRIRSYTARNVGSCGLESRRAALANNQDPTQEFAATSALVSPTMGSWSPVKENEPLLFALDSGSFVSTCSTEFAGEDALLEQKLQEMHV